MKLIRCTTTFAASLFALMAFSPCSAAPVDRQADLDAKKQLQAALAKLSHQSYKQAYDLLERAETALLNRESLNLGADLQIDKPLPTTALMQEIRQSRMALETRNIRQAKWATAQASRDVTSELHSMS